MVESLHQYIRKLDPEEPKWYEDSSYFANALTCIKQNNYSM